MRHKGMTFCKLLGLLVLTLLLTGCAQQPQAPFDGVIATSDVVFNLDFTALNTTYTSTLIVPEGKEIMADIQCDGGRIPTGCRFAPRCAYATERCRQETPQLTPVSDKQSVRCFRAAELAQKEATAQ